MEDLAAFAAGLYVSLLTFSIAAVVVAVLARTKRLPMWISLMVNIIVGLIAAGAISVTWAFGFIPFLGLTIASIILTFPDRKRKPKDQ